MQFPATAPISSIQAVRQPAHQSLQNSVCSGQHRGGLPFSWGRGRQVMHLPCKQVDVGALPTDSTILRLESDQREGFKRRMSSIGLAKEDFPRIGFQAMDGRPCSTHT